MRVVRYSPRAYRDLEEIETYISEQDEAEAAARFVDRIITSIEKLAVLPYRGRKTDDKKGAYVLVIARTKYKVFYDIDAEGVLIQRVWHGARES